MARPRSVAGLDPDRRLRFNARRILAVRIDEVFSFDRLVADPANVTELHDMRIACKRLRYLLETFAVAFDDDLRRFIHQAAALQDILGDIHDCDVQLPMLQQHLATLPEGSDQEMGVRALLDRSRGRRDDLYSEFVKEWRRLKMGRFRARLERALAIRP